MLSSIQARLTGWYSLVLGCVLISFACATYFLLQRNFVKRSDATIVDQADSFLRTVNAELGESVEGGDFEGTFRTAIAEHQSRDMDFLVVDANGRIFESADNDVGQSETAVLGAAPIFRELGKASPEGSFKTLRLGHHTFRAFVRRFSASNTDYTLIVLHSTHDQHEFLEALSRTFAIVIPVSVVLVGAGGYFLARRSLYPVGIMAQQANLISAASLHRRLEIENPDDELGKLARSFNDLLDRLDRAFEQQRRFVADASHELRTPVAILYGETDVVLSQPSRPPEEYRESLEILRIEAGRLKAIIEDLFTLARADAGQYRLTKTRFNLEELVAECVRSARSLASQRGVSMHSDFAAEEMPIVADEVLLRRMLLNVIDNALKYTPRAGSVCIACDQREGGYCVTVQDSGNGIPEELQEKIFERFFRVDPVRSRSESNGGAGLGLSISRLIAAAHGGEIRVSRSDDSGSVFAIWLPASSLDAHDSQLSSPAK